MIKLSINKKMSIKTIAILISLILLFENAGYSFTNVANNKTTLRLPMAFSKGQDEPRPVEASVSHGKQTVAILETPLESYDYRLAIQRAREWLDAKIKEGVLPDTMRERAKRLFETENMGFREFMDILASRYDVLRPENASQLDQKHVEFMDNARGTFAEVAGIKETQIIFISPEDKFLWALCSIEMADNPPSGADAIFCDERGDVHHVIILPYDGHLNKADFIFTLSHETEHCKESFLALRRYIEPLMEIIIEGRQRFWQYYILKQLRERLIAEARRREKERGDSESVYQLVRLLKKSMALVSYPRAERFVGRLINLVGKEAIDTIHKTGETEQLVSGLGQERFEALLLFFREWDQKSFLHSSTAAGLSIGLAMDIAEAVLLKGDSGKLLLSVSRLREFMDILQPQGVLVEVQGATLEQILAHAGKADSDTIVQLAVAYAKEEVSLEYVQAQLHLAGVQLWDWRNFRNYTENRGMEPGVGLDLTIVASRAIKGGSNTGLENSRPLKIMTAGEVPDDPALLLARLFYEETFDGKALQTVFNFEALSKLVSLGISSAVCHLVEEALITDTITPGQAILVILQALSNPWKSHSRTIEENFGDSAIWRTVEVDEMGRLLEYYADLNVRVGFAVNHKRYYEEYRTFIQNYPQIEIFIRDSAYPFDLLLFQLWLGANDKLPFKVIDQERHRTMVENYQIMLNAIVNIQNPNFLSALLWWSEEFYYYDDLPLPLEQALEFWAQQQGEPDAIKSPESLTNLLNKITADSASLFRKALAERTVFTTTQPGRYTAEIEEIKRLGVIEEGRTCVDFGASDCVVTAEVAEAFNTARAIGVDEFLPGEIVTRAGHTVTQQQAEISFQTEASATAALQTAGDNRTKVEFIQQDITQDLPSPLVGIADIVTVLNLIENIQRKYGRSKAFSHIYSALRTYDLSKMQEKSPSVLISENQHWITPTVLGWNVFQMNEKGGLDILYATTVLFGPHTGFSPRPLRGQKTIEDYVLNLHIKGSDLISARVSIQHGPLPSIRGLSDVPSQEFLDRTLSTRSFGTKFSKSCL